MVIPILGRANPGVSYLEIAPLHSDTSALVKRLLEATPRPTGLYLPVDHFCGSFFRALREAGKKPGRTSRRSSATTTLSSTTTSTTRLR